MEQKQIIKHMLTVVLIVIVSFFVWNNAPSQAGAQIASAFDERNILVTFDGLDYLTNISDEDYELLRPSALSLRNISNKSKDYHLYYVISKNSSVPYDSLKLSIDDKVFSLSDIKPDEDDNCYYFEIMNGSLDAYSDMNYDVRVWTTVSSGTLTSSFVTR